MTISGSVPVPAVWHAAFDVQRIRADFPILSLTVRGRPLVYLDNAATTQKPQAVIDALRRTYGEENANIHRGVHFLSEIATAAFEDARRAVQRFLGAADQREIVFVRGTTEAINLVAQTFGRQRVSTGDEIVISEMEHHSNIVPWQMLCQEKGARLRVIPVTDDGELDLEAYQKLLGPRTKLVSIAHVSNALGTVNPVRDMIETAHRAGVPVLVDGAQAVAHMPVDVQTLGCDFYAFSGHKVFGPTGIGALYGRLPLLEAMPPYQTGGDMIRSVTFQKTTFNDVPHKFEAGTPNISGAVGLRAAIDYLRRIDLVSMQGYEHGLLDYATEALAGIDGLRIIGAARQKSGVISFVMHAAHPHDIGTIVDREGVAIRTGHHCAQPLMQRFGVAATARASFALYNTRAEVAALVAAIHKVHEVFA